MSDSEVFSLWCREVLRHMEEIGLSQVGAESPLLDAAIPYCMGCTPLAAARGLLNVDRGLYDRIAACAGEGE